MRAASPESCRYSVFLLGRHTYPLLSFLFLLAAAARAAAGNDGAPTLDVTVGKVTLAVRAPTTQRELFTSVSQFCNGFPDAAAVVSTLGILPHRCAWVLAGGILLAVQKQAQEIPDSPVLPAFSPALVEEMLRWKGPGAVASPEGHRSSRMDVDTTLIPSNNSARTKNSTRYVLFILHDAIPPAVNGGLMASIEAAVALHRYRRGSDTNRPPPWCVRIAVLRDAHDMILRNFPAAAPLLFPYDDFTLDLDAILAMPGDDGSLSGNVRVVATESAVPRSGGKSTVHATSAPPPPPPPRPPPLPDVVVATYFVTVWMALKAVQRVTPPARSQSIPVAYFVQDYEPRFGGLPAEAEIAAALSYVVAPQRVTVVSYSNWVRRELFARHGVPSIKVSCHPRGRGGEEAVSGAPRRGLIADADALTVVAMLRPSTPRRAPWRTVRVLLRVLAAASRSAHRIQVITFGCSRGELAAMWEKNRVKSDPAICPFDHRGVLSHDAVLELFHGLSTVGDGARRVNVDAPGGMLPDAGGAVFLDLSYWQAFGFTGLEAMSEGVVPVVRASSGSLYAKHQVNAMLVGRRRRRYRRRRVELGDSSLLQKEVVGEHDNDDEEEEEEDGDAVNTIMQLLRDPELLARLQVGARSTVRDGFTPADTARSWHDALSGLLHGRENFVERDSNEHQQQSV